MTAFEVEVVSQEEFFRKKRKTFIFFSLKKVKMASNPQQQQ
jgi:hypothetical protein